ncbi:hypothetical protein N7G274_003880 [Stereocaulon virgatum]|uniref:PNPLA domain-containing protein n=1 Tax=Stereocaulon virgatum TaxID=373712 RepID=A0ABR4ACR6_9LECA
MDPAEYFASADIPVGRAINAYIAGLPADESRSSIAARQTIAAFSKQLNDCLNLFRSLIEEMMEASKLSETAKHYFYPIVRRIDDELVRLEIWASDIGYEDPDFGRSPREKDATLTLTRYMTDLLEDIYAWLTETEKNVNTMRALIMQLSGGRFNDFKLKRKLNEILKHIESEYELVALTVRNLVKLTEAFHLEQANELGIGPLAKLQDRMLNPREYLSQGDKPPTVELSQTTGGNVLVADDEFLEPNLQSIEAGKRGPWARSNILTFDGVGTLVFSSLFLLEALITEISIIERESLPAATSSASPLSLQPGSLRQHASETPRIRGTSSASYLPCHYFDYVGGTGLGGLVAIMLGRLRMSIYECLEAFTNLVNEVWSKPRIMNIRSPFLFPQAKYSSKILHQQLEHMVSKVSGSRIYDEIFRQPNQDMCRTAVTAYRERSEIVLFCSYDQPVTASKLIQTLTGTWRIAQIGLAATAAPTYFEPAKILDIDGTEQSYFGGNFGAKDPTPEILTLAAPAGKLPDEAVSTIVSIGIHNFRSRYNTSVRGFPQRLKYLKPWLGVRDRREVSLSMKDRFQATSLEYVRLEIPEITSFQMDTWKGKRGGDTLDLIRKQTSKYLNSADVQERIHATAKRLVDCRRSRAEVDLDRWEVFCHGVEYACTMARCPVIDHTFKSRRGLRSHLEKVHRLDQHTVDSLLDKGKRFPLYESSE